jgi:hypothetical protein
MSVNRLVLAGQVIRLTAVAAAALALVGCESFREAAGIVKTPPDEFAVVTKAPLVIPPDYNLKPPKPGAPPTNQSSPTESAQSALEGTDPAVIAASLPTTYSPEERTILANTGAATADHGIREQISADAKSMETADQSFTDQLLFNSGPTPDKGTPVDADAEHDKLVAEKTNGQTPVDDQTGDSSKSPSHESATITKEASPDSNKDSGWFSGWFDGVF